MLSFFLQPLKFSFSQATEIEKARAVARKALKTISFREEQEKLNVWVALLNLENLYGTSESLEKTLQEAVQASDASKVYTQMLKIFADTNKVEVGFSPDFQYLFHICCWFLGRNISLWNNAA